MSKRVDDNHKSIVDGLRKVGARVQSIAAVGKGCPDLLVAYRGRWFVAEIKDGDKSASRQKLTEAETRWHDSFITSAPIHVWTSLSDALQTIGASQCGKP